MASAALESFPGFCKEGIDASWFPRGEEVNMFPMQNNLTPFFFKKFTISHCKRRTTSIVKSYYVF